jgi:hypothetical protein
MAKVDQSTYLSEGQESPDRSTNNKDHIIWQLVIIYKRRSSKSKSVNEVKIMLNQTLIYVSYDIYFDYVQIKVLTEMQQSIPRKHSPNIKLSIQHQYTLSQFFPKSPTTVFSNL